MLCIFSTCQCMSSSAGGDDNKILGPVHVNNTLPLVSCTMSGCAGCMNVRARLGAAWKQILGFLQLQASSILHPSSSNCCAIIKIGF